jgi:hypothetical protein
MENRRHFLITPEGTLNQSWRSRAWKDPKEQFEEVVNGTWAPYVWLQLMTEVLNKNMFTPISRELLQNLPILTGKQNIFQYSIRRLYNQ